MALVVAACAGCAFLAHRALAGGGSPQAGVLVALVPLAVIVGLLARRLGHATGLAIVALLAALAWWIGWRGLERHYTDLFFLEHAGMMLALAILFGRTLAAGAEPLCTRFARLVHGSIDARRTTYTRWLTATWTAFFLAIATASAALYFTGQREAWSLLANILTPVLVIALFVVEYAVRRWVLPEEEPVGILAAVHAFRRHMAGSEAPR
jgi:uncharacterized membrane protein